jgi:serine/threonine-protein phosphatase 2A regulatory subunit B
MPYKPFFSFAQCFGDRVTEEDNNEADVLSTARFDETGDYLATGDKGGRVVVFQRSDSGKNRHSRKRPHSAVAPGELLETTRDFGGAAGAGGMGGAAGRRGEPVGVKGPSGAEYSFFAEFQSHSPEFDCLKSAEIEEKINKVSAGGSLFFIAEAVG